MRLERFSTDCTVIVLRNGTEILFSSEIPVAARVATILYRTKVKQTYTTERHIGKWLNGVPALQVEQKWLDHLVLDA
jgi:hypothetical protein